MRDSRPSELERNINRSQADALSFVEKLSVAQFLDWASVRVSPKRAKRGAHFTPFNLSCWMASNLPTDIETVLDPACGAGHLLAAVALERNKNGPWPADSMVGWDVDPESAAATRVALGSARGRVGLPGGFVRVRCQDAFDTGEVDPVDLVVSNPPFLSIRALSRHAGKAEVERLRGRWPALSGNFDLYAAFVAGLEEWLKPGGSFAYILPATVWTANYSEAARRTLQRGPCARYQFSQPIFEGLSVHADVVIGQAPRGKSTEHDAVAFSVTQRDGEFLVSESTPDLKPSSLLTLGDVALLSAGIPGYQAQRAAEGVVEGPHSETESLPLIVSKSIDPYRIEHGPIRFIGRTFERPFLLQHAVSTGKWTLFRQPKIVLPGIAKRLEAALDETGYAIGVSVYSVRPKGGIPIEALLGLLNSNWASRWYRQVNRGRRMSGGYYAFNVSQLRQIPVPRSWADQTPDQFVELVALVRARGSASDVAEIARLEDDIDALISAAMESG
ncbi:MAG: N-6 DNA methylase [Myxococcales bacterium]|nr:N-6 DNA methylase [Myxococcales bacterium]